jgi:hypothetical protein
VKKLTPSKIEPILASFVPKNPCQFTHFNYQQTCTVYQTFLPIHFGSTLTAHLYQTLLPIHFRSSLTAQLYHKLMSITFVQVSINCNISKYFLPTCIIPHNVHQSISIYSTFFSKLYPDRILTNIQLQVSLFQITVPL